MWTHLADDQNLLPRQIHADSTLDISQGLKYCLHTRRGISTMSTSRYCYSKRRNDVLGNDGMDRILMRRPGGGMYQGLKKSQDTS